MMMGLELLLLIVLVPAVIWAAQRGWAPLGWAQTNQSSSALDILEKRYAQGEIEATSSTSAERHSNNEDKGKQS